MRFVIRVIGIGVVALLTGCYLKQIDLVEEEWITVQARRTKNVSISAVSAYQVGEHLLISGTISQKKAIQPFSGWVQVTVILDNGEVFEESCHRVFAKPALRQQGRMGNKSFFDVTLPHVPPPGAVIRVVGSAEASLCV
jgi:hypothetical protein